MLKVGASPEQTASINSSAFPVTAGADYTLTFAARVAPASACSGYFTLIFSGASGEVQRTRVPLYLPPLGFSATTDGSGAFRVPLAGLSPALRLVVEARYAGDPQH